MNFSTSTINNVAADRDLKRNRRHCAEFVNNRSRDHFFAGFGVIGNDFDYFLDVFRLAPIINVALPFSETPLDESFVTKYLCLIKVFIKSEQSSFDTMAIINFIIPPPFLIVFSVKWLRYHIDERGELIQFLLNVIFVLKSSSVNTGLNGSNIGGTLMRSIASLSIVAIDPRMTRE